MTATPQTFSAPRGMRDFYPEDMSLRNYLFDAWRRAAVQYGFQHYDACVVESLDLLKRKAGEEIAGQIYAFEDKSGRELALRPEMTPTLARMIVARQGSLSFPVKWFTIAQCFRYERTTRGRKREHYQWNLDIIGETAVTAEAEVIATAVEALRCLGLGAADVVIPFSSRALLTELLLRHDIAREHHPATFLALDKRGKISDAEIRELLLGEGLTEAVTRDVFKLMDIETLEDVRSALGQDTEAYLQVKEFIAIMETYGMADMLRFDISVIRGLAYYTGIVFEAFDVNRRFRAIFGGGRYDDLLGQLGGKPASGVGLGFGDVVVAELLTELGREVPSAGAECAVAYREPEQRDAAIRVARKLRQQGTSTELALAAERKPGRFFSRADKSGCRQAVYIGADDVAKGVVRVKTLATRDEQDLLID